MRKHSLHIVLICLLCGALLAGCTASVRIGGERLPAEAESISAVLRQGETDKLDKFTALKAADLSGSACYEEIFAWAQAHPQVDVSYTVEFPGGAVVKNSDKSADLSAVASEDLSAALTLLAYLPQLEEVKLGNITLEELKLLADAYPDIVFDRGFSLGGKSFSSADERIDLTGISTPQAQELISMLPFMTALKEVELGGEGRSKLSWEDISALQQARPDVDFSYGFTLFDGPFNTLDTQMDLNHIPMSDEGAAVLEVLPCMTRLESLDMDSCGVSNEGMAAIRDAYPNVEVIWRIWFGAAYSVRTNVIKVLASKPSVGGNLTSADADVLKYCTKMKYLDLGHNGDAGGGITDISFISTMPDLEVLIIAMNSVTDLSPLANCPKIEYLEIFTNPISDISVLAELTNLRHIRMHNMPNVTDISPLYNITELERLLIDWHTPVPKEQLDKLQECAPNCEILTADDNRWTIVDIDPVTWDYIYVPRYALLRQQLGYDTLDYSFYWRDPKY